MFNQITIKERIHVEKGVALYRGFLNKDKSPILIKTLIEDHPDLIEVARLEQEFQLLKSLISVRFVPKVIKLIKKANTVAILMADTGEKTLQEILVDGPLKIEDFLHIAISLASALRELHHQRLIHKDIKPINILVNPESYSVKIINFNSATLLTHEVQAAINPEELEGTLAYMSPEQTGRMGRPIDYRSDLYSLGVTFYEMLTGKLPFETEDPVSIVHAHIAKMPVPPHEQNPKIPKMISEIVLKLMAKAAEDRYQSTYGLISDLKNCLDQLESTQEIKFFSLGKYDIPASLHISQKLYGREEELRRLLLAFEQVTSGECATFLVAGAAGIGKSRLIQEAHKSLSEANTLFCEGKFDQLRQVPNSEWAQALGGLVRQILSEKEQNIALFKTKLSEALKDEGQVIVELVPELEFLIGKQPPIPPLLPNDAKIRFYRVFRNFIQAFADESHPLVIFLDDLQWAGVTSLELFIKLLTQFKLKYVLVIAAYRDEKINQYHLLTEALNQIRDKVTTHFVKLHPMSEQHITQLLVDSLYANYQKVVPLARICYEKTRGNPFYLHQFLQLLYSENLLTFRPWQGKWDWDIKKIVQKESTDNVIDLMINRLDKLPFETQQILHCASCVGNKFNSDILAKIYKKSVEEILEILWPALQKGYILPFDETYKFVKTIKNINVNFHFLHDRVQQAANITLSEEQRKRVHFLIGRNLLKKSTEKEQDKNIFDIVNHFNNALDLIKTKQVKEKIVSLNVISAKKAKQAAAFQFAYHYAATGLSLLSQETWTENYPLMLEVSTQAAETAYLVTDFAKVEELSDVILQNAKLLLDKMRIYEIKISALFIKGKLNLAVDEGLKILKELGCGIPRKPSKRQLLVTFLKIKWLFLGKDIMKFSELPEMTDSHKLSIMSMLFIVSLSAFFIEPELFGYMGLRMTVLSIKYGNSVLSILAYTACIFFFTILNDFKTANQLAKLSTFLSEKYNAKTERSISEILMASVLYPRTRNLNRALPVLWQAFQTGLESTLYVEFAWQSLGAYVIYSHMAGKELSSLIDLIKKYYAYTKEHRLNTQRILFAFFIGFLTDVRYGSSCKISDKKWHLNYLQAFDELKKSNNQVSVSALYADLAFFHYTYGYYDLAFDELKFVNVESINFLYVRAIYHLTNSLLNLTIYPTANKKKQRQILRTARKDLKLLKKWSKYGSVNFLNKYYMLAAELARIEGNQSKAEEYYNKAIKLSQKNTYINEEALATELAGKYYVSIAAKKFAKVYLTDAYYCYLKWGCVGKVEQIKEEYREYLAPEILGERTKDISISSSISKISTIDVSRVLDLETILKSTQILSREVVLPKLVSKILHVMLENMGADECLLLLEKNNQLYIEGKYLESGQQKYILRSQPLTDWKQLPQSIIDYVQRTQQNLVLNDVLNIDPYSKDPYILAKQPRSILCAPIVSHQKLLGILYFENKLTANAFTSDRLNILTPLSLQIAISIENARLYQAIERFVPKEFLMLLERRTLTDIQLGDAIQKVLSILFMDIKGFTTLSEKLAPIDLFHFINTYLSYMEPVIADHEGFIDKYLGDGIMALFPHHADHAVRAAINLQEAIIKYNKNALKEGQEITARIGINTGAVMLGTVGTAHRIDGSAISDAVNTAARIMDINRYYGTQILIGESTYGALQDPNAYKLRRLDKIALRGKDEPIMIWEVMTTYLESPTPSQKLIQEFEQAWSYYEAGDFESAKKLFAEYLANFPNDKASEVFLHRCNDFLKYGCPEDWEGVTKF